MVIKAFSKPFQHIITSKSYATYTYQHIRRFVENHVKGYKQAFSYHTWMYIIPTLRFIIYEANIPARKYQHINSLSSYYYFSFKF